MHLIYFRLWRTSQTHNLTVYTNFKHIANRLKKKSDNYAAQCTEQCEF